ncbi:MAG: SRPBCC family protein, partial [Fimbriimonas ginsengisoli]|nr:SRPBCC family protein [Fimbriimonas ginsengisoli]
AQVTIRGSKAAIWAVVTDIDRFSETLSGVEKIEVLERPAQGLVGLKWRETHMLFGKPATADKWVTEAIEQASYTTRAESDGFVFITTTRIADDGHGGDGHGGVTLTGAHDSQPQTFAARWFSIPMMFFFKGTIRKAIRQDLNDVKSVIEK